MLGISWISNLHRAVSFSVLLQRHCLTPIVAHHKHRGQRWISEFRKFSKSKPRPKKIFALLGAKFHVVTDHRALVFLPTMSRGGPSLVRWAMTLQQFDFSTSYRKGPENVVADGLSRCPHPGDADTRQTPSVKDQKTTPTVVSRGGGDVVPSPTNS